MRGMAHRIGVAQALRTGCIGVALLIGLSVACGKDSSPNTAEPEPGGSTGESDAGAPAEPAPASADAGSSEGPPLISGFNAGPPPALWPTAHAAGLTRAVPHMPEVTRAAPREPD